MRILIEDMSFAYGEKMILDRILLTAEQGERVGIVGGSGGGKSTLLKLVSGLYDVQNGRIMIGDAQTSKERRRNVAMVAQNSPLFPSSIRDNITCGHDYSEEAVLYACRAAQLTEWISSLPDGLDTHVGERGGKVSGGQAQRIAIARALMKNAPVILLDEPTSALDNETAGAVITALSDLVRNKTVLHVSHKTETLKNCDRILKLDGGRLYAQ